MKKLKRPPLCSLCTAPVTHANDRFFRDGKLVCLECRNDRDELDDDPPPDDEEETLPLVAPGPLP